MPRKTSGVRLATIEDARKQRLLTRLRKAEGQVKGIQRMVEEGRYCVEILQQIAAADEALRATAKEVLRNYLENCATTAIRSGDADEAQTVYDEITENFFRFAR
jgi:CsoR family transcriptional regulator, copper-sensing transcriptional repressor